MTYRWWKLLPRYREIYDVVVLDDGSMDGIGRLLRRVEHEVRRRPLYRFRCYAHT